MINNISATKSSINLLKNDSVPWTGYHIFSVSLLKQIFVWTLEHHFKLTF